MAFPTLLEATSNTKTQVGGARLTEAVAALFDRLDGSDWKPVSSDDVWMTARVLVGQRGAEAAAAYAWERIGDLTHAQDRAGLEVWCSILDALDEMGKRHDP